MQLYDWQTECLDKWTENQYKGIVNVVTGAGKTILALAAVQQLEKAFGADDLAIKIIVPKTFLVRQWFKAINESLGVSRDDIGIFLGTHKGKTDRKYMIYVINSARNTLSRHILADDTKNRIFIIADECHHYGTEENCKIFDFVKVIPGDKQYYALGLSATPYCKNYQDVLVPNLGREIYRFTFVQALRAGIISRFSIMNICLEFDADERAEYTDLSDKLALSLLKLKKHCPQLHLSNNQRFFIELDNIMKTHEVADVRQMAQTVFHLSLQRKEIVYLAGSRVKCVIDLIKLLDRESKIIVFGERIEMANEIYEKLNALMPGDVGIYHSDLHESTRKTVLRNFEDSEIRIIVSCKTLDEGLNVSDADIGIIASSTSSERQRIQRLGRILRKKDNGKQSRFYYLYVKDTMEEIEVFHDITEELYENINVIDLYYNEETGLFANSYYEGLKLAAIDAAARKSWGERDIFELSRNIDLGIISCDWLMPEQECIQKIKDSALKSEKNYYIAMLFLIRARLSEPV